MKRGTRITLDVFAFLLSCLLIGAAEARDKTGPLSFEERVTYQKAIEQVYWQHRIWPKENKTSKPSLNQVMPDSVIRAKVEDYLRKSDALQQHWQRPITAEQMQAEMNRMAHDTRQPAVLKELWKALRNDPAVIAECLVRPILVDRFIHKYYSGDERFHGELKSRIESELQRYNTVQTMKLLSGKYQESEWRKKQQESGEPALRPGGPAVISLDAAEWNDWTGTLKQKFAGALPSDPMPVQGKIRGELPVGKLSHLQEDNDRYYVTAVLEKDDAHARIATVEWKKRGFEEWWTSAKQQTRNEIVAPLFAYQLPSSLAPSCTDDTWSPPTFVDVPSGRNFHTAIWTGSEMIVWGGYNGSSYLNTGGRYSPATDTWAPGGTSLTNAPSARFLPKAIWTGTEMVVWGGAIGSSFGSFLGTGGRYSPATDTWAAGAPA